MLAFMLVFAGTPPATAADTLAEATGAAWQPEACLIAVADDEGALADEHIVGSWGHAFLLGYESADNAAEALERLLTAGVMAEPDGPLWQADGPNGPLLPYGHGKDPFSLAAEAAHRDGNRDEAGKYVGTARLTGPAQGPEAAGASIVLYGETTGADTDAEEKAAPGEAAEGGAGVYIQVLDADGRGTKAAVYAALQLAAELGATSAEIPYIEGLDGCPVLSDAIDQARKAGLVMKLEEVAATPAPDGANGEADDSDGDGAEDGRLAGASPQDEGTSEEDPSKEVTGQDAADSPESGKADAVDAAPAAPRTAQARRALAAAQTGTLAKAMSITQTATELRGNLGWGGHYADRSSSSVPANEVVLDKGSRLPLRDAKMEVSGFKNGNPVRATRSINMSQSSNPSFYGLWLPFDDSYVKGKDVKVAGTIKLTWSDIGSDAAGNRLDLALTITDICLNTNDTAAKKSKSVCLMRNSAADGKSGYLDASARMQSVSGQNLRCGVSMKITGHLYLKGTKTDTKSRFVMKFTDIDMPDHSASTGGTYAASAGYVESIQLVSGFDSKVCTQQEISQKEKNGSDSWTNPGKASDGSASWGKTTLSVTKSSGLVRATSASLQSGADSNPRYFRTGFTASTSANGGFAFVWAGSKCDTFLFLQYDGIAIRDKSDDAKAGTTDQGIVRKTVNNDGQRYPNAAGVDGSKRCATSWRTTDMPWKGSATYTFSARKGYRVSKVTLKGYEGNAVKLPTVTYTSGTQLKSLSFNGSGSSGARKTVMDYDIVVTTAKVADAAATLSAKKKLSGAALKAGDFNVGLYSSKSDSAKPIATAKNDAAGNFAFSGLDALTFVYDDQAAYPITKTFYLHEVPGSTAGMSYDGTWWEATVKVDYSSTFKPSTTVAYKNLSSGTAAASPTFSNTYTPHGGVKVKKVDAGDGKPLAGATFGIFAGEHGDAAAAMASGKPIATMKSGADGIASLGASTLPGGGYTVVETAAPSGYLLGGESGSSDASPWSRTFKISEDGQIADLTGDPCANAPKSPTSAWWAPRAVKELAGGKLEGGEFSFELVRPDTGEVLQAASNDREGDIAFRDIEFSAGQVGWTYHYVLREKAGGDPQTSYDTAWWQVDVTPVQDGDSLAVKAMYAKHVAADAYPASERDAVEDGAPDPDENGAVAAAFTNTHLPRVGVTARKQDSMSGTPLAHARFEVRAAYPEEVASGLYAEDGKPVESLTIETDGDGVARTHPKALEQGGAYRIREVQAAPGYGIDDASWRIFTATGQDGDEVDAGTWEDSPLACSATITVRKENLLQTGTDSHEALAIPADAFWFGLHEGSPSGTLLQRISMPAAPDGVAEVSFAPIAYGTDDVGEHVYYVVEEQGDDARVAYDVEPRKVVVQVEPAGGGEGSDLAVKVDDGDPARDAQVKTVFQNVLHPGFDIAISKSDAETGKPLKGSLFGIFKMAPLGTGSSIALPEALADKGVFESCFHIDERGRTLSYDAGELAEHGLEYVAGITSGADGRAATEGQLLDAGTAYAVVELAAPSGYLLVDMRAPKPQAPTVYIVDDAATDGRYAHLATVGNEGSVIARHLDSAGTQLPANGQPECTAAYRYTVGSPAADAAADTPMAFENPPSGEELGGVGARKADADTGAGLAGAVFWVWPEDVFQEAYGQYRDAHHADADDAAFLALLTGAAYGEARTEDDGGTPAASQSPYLREPVTTLEPTDADGNAATAATELPPGTYRVVEVEAPADYALPEYDFQSASAGLTGNAIVEVRAGEIAYAEQPFQDRYSPKAASAPIDARKTMTGAPLGEGAFLFKLYAADDESFSHILLAARNDAAGRIALGSFSYSGEGQGTVTLSDADGHVRASSAGQDPSKVFTYRLVEDVPEAATCDIGGSRRAYGEYAAENGVVAAGAYPWEHGGIVYDAAVRTLKVEVEDDGGTLRATSSWEGCPAVFENASSDRTPKGGLRLMKAAPDGTPLAGARFTVEGTRADDGKPFSAELVSDEDGMAQLAPDTIPLGSYTVRELNAPAGYALNADWHKEFTLEQEGDVADFTQEQGDWCVDEKLVPMPITGAEGTAGISACALAALMTSLAIRNRRIRRARSWDLAWSTT